MVFYAMVHISGNSRSQLLLLPERVDDYVGSDNPVRFIDAFVDGLDLQDAGFSRVQPRSTGRPGYDPADLLKLYIYGYLNRVRSSRRLETETHRNIEVIWLLRHLKPDFKTIADFRRDNRQAFRQIFRPFVILCRELDLFGRALIAVDGTRIKAVNGLDRNFTKAKLERTIRESDERLEKYLQKLDEADASTHDPSDKVANLQEKITAIKERRETLTGYQKQLAESGEDQISLTDPDSRAMHTSTRIGVGYNIQIAVDTKYKLIVEQQVHNKVSDLGLLAVTAEAARDTLGVDSLKVVADRGYYKIEDIEACENFGVVPYVPKPRRSPAASRGHFTKEQFKYDQTSDIYVCPEGQTLSPRYISKVRDQTLKIYCNRAACKNCKSRQQCTIKKYRGISRYENEDVLDRMAKRLAKDVGVMDQRRESVEHPFGSIKHWMGQGTFLMRRMENVRGEFSLTALAYNIRRAITLVGVPALIKAADGV